MLKILGKIPSTHFHVACSGGTDSMVLIDFLRRYPKNKFDIIHFNHGTSCCQEAENFIVDFCSRTGIKLHLSTVTRERKPEESQEEYWRNMRYSYFAKFSNEPILMAHHLNDVIETWVMTSLHGQPKLIPYFNPKFNIIRPLLATPKSAINDWIKRHNVEHVIDSSNYNTDIPRNLIRHKMMEDIIKINPGIETTIKKKILDAYRMHSSKD